MMIPNTIISFSIMSLSLETTATTVGSRCHHEIAEWLAVHRFPELRPLRYQDDKVTLELSGNMFEMMVPADFPKRKTGTFMLMPSPTCEITAFLEEFNSWIFEKNPKLGKLLRQLEKRWRGNSVRVVHKSSVKFSSLDAPSSEALSDGFDLEELKLKKYLKGLAETSKTDFTIDDSKAGKVVKMFDSTSCTKLVVKEYMSVYKEFHKTGILTLELVDENLFHWRLSFSQFENPALQASLRRLKELYGYDNIVIDLMFHSSLFPTYPIMAKCIRPKLEESLMHRIPNMKIFQFERWNPTRATTTIVRKLHQVLTKFASVNVENDLNDISKNPSGAYFALESYLMKLASLFEDSSNSFDPLDEESYPLITMTAPKTQTAAKAKTSYSSSTTKTSGWAKGTGYGTSGSTNWDPSQYKKMKEEKNRELNTLIREIYKIISTHEGSRGEIFRTLKGSYLIPFIKSHLNGTTLMEMSRNVELYRTILDLVVLFTNEEGVFLFDDKSSKNLYYTLTGLMSKMKAIAHIKTDDDDGEAPDETQMLINTIQSIVEMVGPHYAMYESMKMAEEEAARAAAATAATASTAATSDDTATSGKDDTAALEKAKLYQRYVDEMKRHQFDATIFKHHKYSGDAGFKPSRAFKKRVRNEIDIIINSAPLGYESSVLVRTSEKRIPLMKAMITGPHDTPYDSGVYIFDVVMPNTWPQGPPKCWHMRNGGYRNNPNLYEGGKVCLSLLGTWGGSGAETWNADLSSMQQLFTSISGLILIPDPYFNEPSYESSRGTERGNRASEAYNQNIRMYTVHAMMIQALENPAPEFKEAIMTHFRIKKDHVKKTVAKWVEIADSGHKSKMQDYQKKLNKLLDKL